MLSIAIPVFFIFFLNISVFLFIILYALQFGLSQIVNVSNTFIFCFVMYLLFSLSMYALFTANYNVKKY